MIVRCNKMTDLRTATLQHLLRHRECQCDEWDGLLPFDRGPHLLQTLREASLSVSTPGSQHLREYLAGHIRLPLISSVQRQHVCWQRIWMLQELPARYLPTPYLQWILPILDAASDESPVAL